MLHFPPVMIQSFQLSRYIGCQPLITISLDLIFILTESYNSNVSFLCLKNMFVPREGFKPLHMA